MLSYIRCKDTGKSPPARVSERSIVNVLYEEWMVDFDPVSMEGCESVFQSDTELPDDSTGVSQFSIVF